MSFDMGRLLLSLLRQDDLVLRFGVHFPLFLAAGIHRRGFLQRVVLSSVDDGCDGDVERLKSLPLFLLLWRSP